MPNAAIQANSVLFKQVDIFNGHQQQILESYDVLVQDNKITSIEKTILAPDNAQVINGQGYTLTPGLIDMHWHSLLTAASPMEVATEDFAYLAIVAEKINVQVLQNGFTTVRDMGGNSFALKKLADSQKIAGPRIFPSGSGISQTSGHGDTRDPRTFSSNYFTQTGMMQVADGVPEVLRLTRQNLMRGATQIKVMAGGGTASQYDPLDSTQFSLEELTAVVEAAKDWGTYVAAHAYTDRAVRRAIKAGVISIEHGHLLSEDTVKLIAEKDIWLSLQPFFIDEDSPPLEKGSFSEFKYKRIVAGTERIYKFAKKHNVKIAFGTDVVTDENLSKKQGKTAAKLSRWFSNYEIMKMLTYDNAQLLALSGKRNNYGAPLGVIEEGALADLILIDGNPLQDISLIADPLKNFVIIMKDGVIYKDSRSK